MWTPPRPAPAPVVSEHQARERTLLVERRRLRRQVVELQRRERALQAERDRLLADLAERESRERRLGAERDRLARRLQELLRDRPTPAAPAPGEDLDAELRRLEAAERQAALDDALLTEAPGGARVRLRSSA